MATTPSTDRLLELLLSDSVEQAQKNLYDRDLERAKQEVARPESAGITARIRRGARDLAGLFGHHEPEVEQAMKMEVFKRKVTQKAQDLGLDQAKNPVEYGKLILDTSIEEGLPTIGLEAIKFIEKAQAEQHARDLEDRRVSQGDRELNIREVLGQGELDLGQQRVDVTKRGQDINREVGMAGIESREEIAGMQDATARRGQDISSETSRRGQDVTREIASERDATTRRGQDLTAEVQRERNKLYKELNKIKQTLADAKLKGERPEPPEYPKLAVQNDFLELIKTDPTFEDFEDKHTVMSIQAADELSEIMRRNPEKSLTSMRKEVHNRIASRIVEIEDFGPNTKIYFESPEQVWRAVQNGDIENDEGIRILTNGFGYRP